MEALGFGKVQFAYKNSTTPLPTCRLPHAPTPLGALSRFPTRNFLQPPLPVFFRSLTLLAVSGFSRTPKKLFPRPFPASAIRNTHRKLCSSRGFLRWLPALRISTITINCFTIPAFRPRLALQISPAALRCAASKTVSIVTPSINSTRLC